MFVSRRSSPDDSAKGIMWEVWNLIRGLFLA